MPLRAEHMQTSHPHAALEGASIIITRPAGTGGALAARVRALGGRPVALPGLVLRATTDDAVARALRGARDAPIWIFSSPAAVRFAFRLAPALRIARTAQVFTVGAGSARALSRRGIAARLPSTTSDSEGLLALAELSKVRGQRIVLVGAPGGRDLIAPTLRRRGAKVEPIHVYRREPPRLTQRHFDAVAALRNPLITLVSSAEALTNLVALVPRTVLARLRGQVLVVSSARLADVARAQGFKELVQAKSALPRDLLDAAQTAIARHRL
ncbi:MAG: uroporphyrinogen-III synthase [Rhodanobacteraceae bacterium]